MNSPVEFTLSREERQLIRSYDKSGEVLSGIEDMQTAAYKLDPDALYESVCKLTHHYQEFPELDDIAYRILWDDLDYMFGALGKMLYSDTETSRNASNKIGRSVLLAFRYVKDYRMDRNNVDDMKDAMTLALEFSLFFYPPSLETGCETSDEFLNFSRELAQEASVDVSEIVHAVEKLREHVDLFETSSVDKTKSDAFVYKQGKTAYVLGRIQ